MSRKSQLTLDRFQGGPHRDKLEKALSEITKADEGIAELERRLNSARLHKLQMLGENMAILTDAGVLKVNVNEYELHELVDELTPKRH